MANRYNPNHWKTEGKGKNPKYEWRRKDRASSSVPPPPPPSWIELPRDITANILQRLCTVDILESAQKVCTTWRSVCQDPAMWRKIDMSDINQCNGYFNAEVMCQHAVDRSRGQLVDIKIGYFWTGELLEYIAERSGRLRCLSLAYCNGISEDSWIEAIQRFPLLEELHLFVMNVPIKLFELIGHSCPMLKSFTLSNYGGYSMLECDSEALAIAKAMPQLRCLDLFGNTLTNKGLLAILDGCAHLESLDIRKCFRVDLGGDLGKRCSQQLKYLRQPNDSTADYEYDVVGDTDSFNGYTCGFSDLSIDEDYYLNLLNHDDFMHWDVDSDNEDFVDGWCSYDDD